MQGSGIFPNHVQNAGIEFVRFSQPRFLGFGSLQKQGVEYTLQIAHGRNGNPVPGPGYAAAEGAASGIQLKGRETGIRAHEFGRLLIHGDIAFGLAGSQFGSNTRQIGMGSMVPTLYTGMIQVRENGEVITQPLQRFQEPWHVVVATDFLGKKSLRVHGVFQTDANHAHGFDALSVSRDGANRLGQRLEKRQAYQGARAAQKCPARNLILKSFHEKGLFYFLTRKRGKGQERLIRISHTIRRERTESERWRRGHAL